MSEDIFAHRDWSEVLRQIEQLAKDRKLDDHQAELIRLAATPGNWQLRHAALRAMAQLVRPSDDALDTALRVVLDDRSDLETRILAGEALVSALNLVGGLDEKRTYMVDSLERLLHFPQPPVLHRSVRGWLDTVRQPVRATLAHS